MRIEEFDDLSYDPFAADEMNFGDHLDPYPVIAKLRRKGPVHEGSYRNMMGLPDSLMPDRKTYTVVGTDEIQQCFLDTDRFSNGAYMFNLGVTFGRSISTMDNPEHGRWRRIFQRIFLPQYVKHWGETIVDPVVHGLMDRFRHTKRADLIADFTLRYPFEVIYRQLALPEDDVHTFQRLAIAQTDYVNSARAIEAGRKLGIYFGGLIAERRANPGEDLISLLALTEVEGDFLPEEVLVSFLRQLMNAAGDTTYRGTSILLTALIDHPTQMSALSENRDLMPQAIEEALRWDGPVVVAARMAAVDTSLGGVDIKAGSLLNVVSAAANRDPSVWENPDEFDIFRARKPHFSFARGPHMCVGLHLARVEMARALNAILDELKGLRFDPAFGRPDIRGCMMRVPRMLPVVFD